MHVSVSMLMWDACMCESNAYVRYVYVCISCIFICIYMYVYVYIYMYTYMYINI